MKQGNAVLAIIKEIETKYTGEDLRLDLLNKPMTVYLEKKKEIEHLFYPLTVFINSDSQSGYNVRVLNRRNAYIKNPITGLPFFRLFGGF
jgi:hypothetical protein